MPRLTRPPLDMPEPQAALLEALATPLARAVVHHLSRIGPTGISGLVEATGVGAGGLRLHLIALEQVGIVVATEPPSDRHGRRVQYDVDDDRVLDAVEAIASYLLPPEVSRANH